MTAPFRFLSIFAAVAISSGHLYSATTATFDGGPDTPASLQQFDSLPGPSIQPGGGNPGGCLQLTSEVPLQHNFVTFDQADIGPVQYSLFSFQFRITATQGHSADGFSFSYANTVNYGTNGGIAGLPFTQAENPAAAGILGFGFDTWNNGSPYDSTVWGSGTDYSEISIFYNGALIDRVDDTRWVPFYLVLDDGQWHSVSGNVNFREGRVSLTVDGSVIWNNLTIPGFVPFESRIMFAGRTGGENEKVDIDNLTLLASDGRSRIERITPQSPGALIEGSGRPTFNYSIETSADFVTWSWRTSVVANALGSWQFFEPQLVSSPLKFYRASTFPRGLITWYRADGNYNDSFGTNHGAPEGGMSFATGLRGRAFSFDGVNESMLITSAGAIPPPWTAAFWVKRQDTPDVSAALLADGATALKLEQWPSTRKVGFTKFGVADYAFNYLAPAGTWVHLTFVCWPSPGETRLYVNGLFKAQILVPIDLPLQFLGRRDTGQERLRGLLDEIAIFNRTLNDFEIYQLTITTSEP